MTTGEEIISVEYGWWQVCPKCQGQGIVSKPSWIPYGVDNWSSTSAFFVCDICNGAKIIERPVINPINKDNR